MNNDILLTPVPTAKRRAPKIRYFAYGPNMNPEQIQERCSNPVVIGPARLPGYQMAFFGYSWIWDSGMETVIPAPGKDLWGVIYELGSTDADSLDAWQDIRLNGTGSYFHSPVVIFSPEGEQYEAVLYRKDILGTPTPPSREFLEFILQGARIHGLPESYVKTLAEIPSKDAAYSVPRRRDEDRDALRTTSCPDCSSLIDEYSGLEGKAEKTE
ncbi:gamma-glutamylcyclotransferase family protein [Maridesulfovibrio sp.]|uniref:gamma-glutamylcyclotransferase family protein n=1 Tax=Maridesulfovibrio sp. TaxID=2795000 RepID=UPI002A18CA53|nr:gamma-glutamylcyclotransferase family protein [Maridesulfovibrio sp.]